MLSPLVSPSWDTHAWVGAEYTPWNASNELWWTDYLSYKPTVDRELGLLKKRFGFTALRVWVHSMLYAHDADALKRNVSDFLALAHSHGFGVGLVLFDDCWNKAGANLSSPCVPQKGLHNGCWMRSPQEIERTSVARFKPYVTDLVSTFGDDARVLWWETYNEPDRSDNFSLALRKASYGWAKATKPTQPVASCWDDSADTDLVDHHQYALPWGRQNAVWSNPRKGGFISEAGSRWYQYSKGDAGSVLTLVNWLDQMKVHHLKQIENGATGAEPFAPGQIESGASSGEPFVPGVMLQWECMVGHSNTRWHWGSKVGTAEPAIPWDAHLFPDGTPVSFTEAAAIKRYTTGVDSFLALETYLQPSLDAPEAYLTIAAGSTHELVPKTGGRPSAGAVYELAFWPTAANATLRVTIGGADKTTAIVEADPAAQLLRASAAGGSSVMYNISKEGKPEGGVLVGAWNLLRVIVQPIGRPRLVDVEAGGVEAGGVEAGGAEAGGVEAGDVEAGGAEAEGAASVQVRVFLNPQFPDVAGASVAPPGTSPTQMPPRIELTTAAGVSSVGAMAVAADGGAPQRVDYMSITRGDGA